MNWLELIWDVLLDALLDGVKMLPFLFGAYLLIEWLEHKGTDKLAAGLQKMGRFGPLGGAILGCVPQCGFSVAASNLYAGRLITAGTLMAVFLSTSDEAVPVILAHPEQLKILLPLLLTKIIIAMIAGMIIDLLSKRGRRQSSPDFGAVCEHCGCHENHSVLLSALRHTAGIFLLILAANILFGGIVALIGEEQVMNFLGGIRFLQPVVAGLIGLIPNCAASVILTELYLQGGLTFGSIIAGLSTGAGLGVVVLFRANHHHLKENIWILTGLYGIGVASGMILDLLVR